MTIHHKSEKSNGDSKKIIKVENYNKMSLLGQNRSKTNINIERQLT